MAAAVANATEPSLPYVAVPQPQGNSEVNSFTGAKILVLDDEPATVDALGHNLRKQGFIPIIAENAAIAVRLLYDTEPD